MSGQERKARVPVPPLPTGSSGNLLSSVAPPTQLPNFLTSAVEVPQPVPLPAQVVPQIPQVTPQTPQVVPHSPQVVPANISMLPQPVQPVIVKTNEEDKFSPAIPLSKAEPTVSIRSPDGSQSTQTPESLSEQETDKLGDIMPGSGLLTWVKGAVSSGGILQRVAEKAKSSVDSMITTLDPQMKEYLNSGGDLLVVVASDKDTKVSPIREAFQNVFGKATVVGYPAQSDVTAIQPVGYAAAYAAAKQRIAHIRSVRSELTNNVPVLAVEGFIHEAIVDRWYELNLLVLSQPSLDIELQVQSQGAPLPAAAAAAAREGTDPQYGHLQTGYSVTVSSIMAHTLQCSHTNWQEVTTGVSRREILALAAKSLAGSYKKILAVSAGET